MNEKIKRIINKKNKSKIICLTAYSKNIASEVDKHADIVLVGDSLASVLYNYSTTRKVTLDNMISHAKSVRLGVKKSLMVVDMPFNTYKTNSQTLKNAKKINKKVRKLALAQTLSKKNIDKKLYILNDVKKEIKKTKEFNKFLVDNNLSNALIVSDKKSKKNINKSARNIKNLKIINNDGANIYDMLKYTNVILTSTSIKKIEEKILNEKN